MQDDDSPISAASFQPVDKSYQLLANVSTLAQGGHISAWANVETCGSVASSVVHFGEKRCGEDRRAARSSTPSRRHSPPSSKRRDALPHNNQLGQKGKGGRTGESFCLFYSTAPPTNTSSIYFISLKGGSPARLWCRQRRTTRGDHGPGHGESSQGPGRSVRARGRAPKAAAAHESPAESARRRGPRSSGRGGRLLPSARTDAGGRPDR